MKQLLAFFALGALVPLLCQQTQQETATPAAEKEKRCIVQGQVLNLVTGEPIRKADVKLAPASNSGLFAAGAVPAKGNTYVGTTDAEGKFNIEDIAAGSYSLSVKRNGFLETRYGARKPQQPGTTLTLSAGQTLKELHMKMTPQGVIAGKVLDDEGEPVQNSLVMALAEKYLRGRRQMLPAGTGMSNDRGEYRVGNLDPGKYILMAPPPLVPMTAAERKPDGKPETGLTAVYFPGVTDQSQAAKIELGPGAELTGHDLRLQRGPAVRVKGKLVDGTSGKAITNTMLSLMPRDSIVPVPRNMVQVGNEGKFELGGIVPGSYTLISISAAPVQMTILQSLEVGDKNIDNLVVTSTPPPSVLGTVTVEGGMKVKLTSIRVILMPAQGSPLFGVSMDTAQEDGSLTLKNVSAAKYGINVVGTPDGTYVKAIRVADQDVLGKDIDWSSGVSGTIQITLGADPAQVTGKVEKDSAPAPGVTVVLIPADTARRHDMFYKTASTDQAGNFTMKNVHPMDYKVFAWEDVESGAWADPEFMKQVESKGVDVKADKGGSAAVQLKVIR